MAKGEDFVFREDSGRIFGSSINARDQSFANRNLALLEPIDDVGFSAHWSDFNHLVKTE